MTAARHLATAVHARSQSACPVVHLGAGAASLAHAAASHLVLGPECFCWARPLDQARHVDVWTPLWHAAHPRRSDVQYGAASSSLHPLCWELVASLAGKADHQPTLTEAKK